MQFIRTAGKKIGTCLLPSCLIFLLLVFFNSPILQANEWPAPADNKRDDFAQLYQRATTGDADAQFAIFRAYRNGTGVERNIDTAIHWLRAAGESGHAEAQYWLGYIYFTGQGVARNVESSFTWYKKAASQGFLPAQVALGDLYNGTHYKFYPSDLSQALRWYTKAAEQGHLRSIFIVGCKYYFGIEQAADLEQGRYWFQRAAQAGDDTATAYLNLHNEDDLRLFCVNIARI